MLASNEFVHLHLHSEYSLLDGAIRISDIPRLAKEAGHVAVALTDHGNMYGAVAFAPVRRRASSRSSAVRSMLRRSPGISSLRTENPDIIIWFCSLKTKRAIKI